MLSTEENIYKINVEENIEETKAPDALKFMAGVVCGDVRVGMVMIRGGDGFASHWVGPLTAILAPFSCSMSSKSLR